MIVNVHGASYTNIDPDTLGGMFCCESLLGIEDMGPISVLEDDRVVIPQRILPDKDYTIITIPYVAWAPYLDTTFRKHVGPLISLAIDSFKHSIVATRFVNHRPTATICFGTNNDKTFKGVLTFVSAVGAYLPEAVGFEAHDHGIRNFELGPSSIYPKLLGRMPAFVAPPTITITTGDGNHHLTSESGYGFTPQDLKHQLMTTFGFLPRKLQAQKFGIYSWLP